jgi:hypothetical protein
MGFSASWKKNAAPLNRAFSSQVGSLGGSENAIKQTL